MATEELRVRLFGELDLRVAGRPLPPLTSGRARSLLGHLILHGDVPQSRQRLAFLLWPDSTESQARTNLRNVLHTLRHATPELEAFLAVTSTTLQWRREGGCWVDVDAFTAAADEAGAAVPGSDEELAALRRAADLYSGDLLDGCYDEWLEPVRRRFAERHLSILQRLAHALTGRGEHAEALRMARQLVREDPLQEDAHRLLMTIQASAGNRAGAVRAFHECTATLQRELGVDPSAATSDLYESLVGVGAEPTDATGPRVSGPAFVGRATEWGVLTGCWREVESGRAQLVLVCGEPGIGKTRLVEELAAWCARRGATVASARSYATEGALGYGVATSWLRAPEVTRHLQRAGDADRQVLARLLPELGPPPRAGDSDDAEQRRRLFDATAGVLATARPTLLVADDAQWCDEPTLQLVHYLVRRDPETPLLVVATARREEVDAGSPLADLATALARIDRLTEVGLGRLSLDETAALAADLVGGDPNRHEVEGLHGDTEGNPLFVVEAIRAGWDGTSGARPAVTPKLRAVIDARLSQLSAPARDALDVAATVGRAFTAALVGRAGGLDDVTLVRVLDELWRRGIFREHDVDAYDFSHGRIREVAYDELGPAARRRNHGAVAAALQDVRAGDVDAVSGEVAVHLDRAGDGQEAVRWYRRAAVQAHRLDAYADAVRLLERARALVPSLPPAVQASEELAILSLLPTPLIGLDGFASGRLAEVQRRAVEVATATGADLATPVLRSLAMSSLCRDEFAEARAAAARLRAAATESGDDGLAIESEYLLGIGAFWDADFPGAVVHFTRVVDDFVDDQRPDHLLRFGHDPKVVCLSRLANARWFLGDEEGARRARDGAVELAREIAHPYSRGVAYVFAALLALDLDEPDDATRFAAAMGAEQDASLPLQINTRAFGGLADVVAGRFEQGLAAMHAALDACGSPNHAPGFRAALLRVALAGHAIAGDAAGGLATADELLGLGSTRIWEPEARRHRAECLAHLCGPVAEVASELQRAVAAARRLGATGPLRRVERTRAALETGG